MTFTQRMLRAVGWTVDGSGIWWNAASGTTRLQPWPWWTGPILVAVFAPLLCYAIAAGWVPVR